MNIATAILVGGAITGVCAATFLEDGSAEAAPTRQPFAFSINQFASASNPFLFPGSGLSNSPARFAGIRNFSPPSATPKARLFPQHAPAPGLYKTEPFSCLVLVPGPHPDDRALAPGAAVDPKMPIVKPELRLVPWPKK